MRAPDGSGTCAGAPGPPAETVGWVAADAEGSGRRLPAWEGAGSCAAGACLPLSPCI